MLLLRHAVHRPMDARKPNGKVVAQAVHGVVGTGRRDSLDVEIGPLRMLRTEQTAHKFGVRFHLVVVHSRLRHRRKCAARPTNRPEISELLVGVADDIDDGAVRGAHQEPAKAPGFFGQRMNDLVAAALCFRVGLVDIAPNGH